MSHALTLIPFVPIAGMVLILALPDSMKNASKWIAVAATIPQLLIAIHLYEYFDTTTSAVQFAEKASWMPSYHISYFVGVDGISISMILLTALIMFISTFASFGINRAEKGYYAMLLMLDTGMMGVFVSLDFFLFYIFWEVMLLPMYFLIGIWGGPRRGYAAIKFFLYTLLGSVLILLAMLGLYYYGATPTFDLTELAANSRHYSIGFQRIVWIALFIGFAIKVPAFPFHTWLPDAHVEAPTPVSVLLAGVLLKMGGYGIFRICLPMFKIAAVNLAPALAVLAVVNIVYGACVAMAQTDFKKMVAYSSVSHMGFVLLGAAALNVTGFNGAILEMFNHGIITGGLFLLVGILYDRAHTREFSQFGGLSLPMPFYAFCLTFLSLASLGLPGLSGFVGEFMSLAGIFAMHPGLVVVSAIGLIVTVGYFLLMIQRVLLGKVNPKWAGLPDMNILELTTIVPLIFITLVVGFYPQIVLQFQQVAVEG